ncbi:GGDEF domain-containing protein [Paenibacillus lycopersici]|uniref:GGDEF domain-containing protein n=1 Tax=Paenibacillus lycopersici TaxID=2704462 RepID=A0A6C0G2V6_9BACL|nr:GGDEF domain-containing protein [Paenibacillus lycopersici]QHT62293.1 GGDEF domain-containing protein [Paenibacillus lycopersici]
MDEIGYGLLDRTMINRLTDQWHYGGIGVIVAHLHGQPSASAHEAMQSWMNDQQRLIWRYRMENDFYFFLQRGKSEEQLDKLTGRAVRSLQERLKRVYAKEEPRKPRGVERPAAAFAIGHALAFPSSIGRSAEATIYHAVKEALSAVMRLRLRQEHASGAFEQAAAEEGLLNESPFLRSPEPGNDALEDQRLSGDDRRQPGGPSPFPIGELAKPVPTFPPQALVSDLARMFETNQRVQGAVIASEGRPLGLVMKENMNQLLAGQFGLPLYWNRSIAKIMDEEALVVDASWPVEQVAQMAMARDISRLYHVVIITRDEKLLGAASIRSILECLTQLRTEEARTANPLTGLPGNAAIQRDLQRRIDAGRPFAIVYADLDHFKWYNDCFGFSQGDELIRFLASVLQQVIATGGCKDDFVGHIGGDDFILLSEAEDMQRLCRLMIALFDGGVMPYYGGADIPVVTDRSGNPVAAQIGVTLSLSLLFWDGVQLVSTAMISQAAARLKKQAKSIIGSTYVSGSVYEKHLGEGIT